nr:MAG TPA: hypothetical protein [Caudoviricetes sp.]
MSGKSGKYSRVTHASSKHYSPESSPTVVEKY